MNKKDRSLYDQYFEIKNKYKDCIVAFQLGSFHQLYYYDAFLVSEELGLKKSIRSMGGGNYTLMCGVPSNKIQLRADVLALKGYKTVICNAILDEKLGIRVRKVSVINEPKTNKIDISANWEEYFDSNVSKSQDELRQQYGIIPAEKKPKVSSKLKKNVSSVVPVSSSNIKADNTIKMITEEEAQNFVNYNKSYKEFTVANEVLKELKNLEVHNLTMKAAFDLLVEWKVKYDGIC